MSSLPHSVPTRMAHNIAALYGKDDDTLLAWQRFCTQASEALHAAHNSARITKALALAQDGAVELHDDGSACVTTGTGLYEVPADGTCTCPDAQHRDLTCKHALAVLIHTRAQALLAPSTAPEPAPTAPPAPKRQAKARPSTAWDVHEGGFCPTPRKRGLASEPRPLHHGRSLLTG